MNSNRRHGRRTTGWRVLLIGAGVLLLAGCAAAAVAWWSGDRAVRGNAAIAAMIGTGVLGVSLLGVGLLVRSGHEVRRQWLTSWLVTGMCLAGLAVSWGFVLGDSGRDLTVGTPVASAAQADQYLAGHLPPSGHPILIPTGVFLQSIEFTSGSDVTVSGYIWQRYPASVPEEVTRGVVLPEAGDSYAAKEVYKRKDAAGEELIGWYVEAELRQKFDYRAYPLDRQNVWLRMWQPDFDKDAVLVPDFAAYPPWLDSRMLGLDTQLVTGEWVPQYSTFSYAQYQYQTNFGYEPFAAPVSYPDLYFNMAFHRDFRGPTLAKLVPALLIALIVFGALFIMTRDESKMALAGFNSFAVVAFTVTMLVAVIVDHNAVRDLATDGSLLYLEYVYFAIYAMILMVTVNGILLAWHPPPLAVTRHNNLLPKLVYWPATLGFLLAMTLTVFFT